MLRLSLFCGSLPGVNGPRFCFGTGFLEMSRQRRPWRLRVSRTLLQTAGTLLMQAASRFSGQRIVEGFAHEHMLEAQAPTVCRLDKPRADCRSEMPLDLC